MLQSARDHIPGSETDWIGAIGVVAFLCFLACGTWFATLRSQAGWDSRPTEEQRGIAGIAAMSGVLAAAAYGRVVEGPPRKSQR